MLIDKHVGTSSSYNTLIHFSKTPDAPRGVSSMTRICQLHSRHGSVVSTKSFQALHFSRSISRSHPPHLLTTYRFGKEL